MDKDITDDPMSMNQGPLSIPSVVEGDTRFSETSPCSVKEIENEVIIDESALPNNLGIDIPLGAFLDPKSHMHYIARGSFGKVYAYPKETHKVAIKIAKKTKNMSSDFFKELRREVEINTKLSHENIVKYLASFESNSKMFIILEYVGGGSLYRYVLEMNKGHNKDGQSGLTQNEINDFTKQLLTGLCYLHSENIIHRDLRSPNILVTDTKVLKIADFGLSKDLDTVTGSHLDPKSSMQSTLNLQSYGLPPERIDAEHFSRADRQNVKYDIWSLGVLLLETSCVQPPHFSMTDMAYRIEIVSNKNYVPEIPTFINPNVRDVIERCLKRTIEDRPSCQALLLLFEHADTWVPIMSGLTEETSTEDSRSGQIKESLNTLEDFLSADLKPETLQALIEIGLLKNLSSCWMMNTDITRTTIRNLLAMLHHAQNGVITSLVQSNLLADILKHVVEIKDKDIVADILIVLKKLSKVDSQSLMDLGLSSILITLFETYRKAKKGFGRKINNSTDQKIVGHILGIFVNLLTFTSDEQKENVIQTLATNNIVTKCTKWTNTPELKSAAMLLLVSLSCFDILPGNSDIVRKAITDSLEFAKNVLSEDTIKDTMRILIQAGLYDNLKVVEIMLSKYPRTIKTFIEMEIVEDVIATSAMIQNYELGITIVTIFAQVVDHAASLSVVQCCAILQILQNILEIKNNASSTHDTREGEIIKICSNLFKKLHDRLGFKENTISVMKDNHIFTKCKHWYQYDNVELKRNVMSLLWRISALGTDIEYSELFELKIIQDIIKDIIPQCGDSKTVKYMLGLLKHIARNEGHHKQKMCTHMVALGIVPLLNATLSRWDIAEDIDAKEIVKGTLHTMKYLLEGTSGDTKTEIVANIDTHLIQNNLESPDGFVRDFADRIAEGLAGEGIIIIMK